MQLRVLPVSEEVTHMKAPFRCPSDWTFPEGTAVMGFDPMAMRGTKPFETCDNTLMLAEQHGVGTRDLARIEVIGASIGEVRFDYRSAAKRRKESL